MVKQLLLLYKFCKEKKTYSKKPTIIVCIKCTFVYYAEMYENKVLLNRKLRFATAVIKHRLEAILTNQLLQSNKDERTTLL